MKFSCLLYLFVHLFFTQVDFGLLWATKESKDKPDSHCPLELSLVVDQNVSLQTQFLTAKSWMT